MENLNKCLICFGTNVRVWRDPPSLDGKNFECARCGRFDIAGSVMLQMENGSVFPKEQLGAVSNYLRKSKSFVITSDTLNDLKKLKPLELEVQSDNLLHFFKGKYSRPGMNIEILYQSLGAGDGLSLDTLLGISGCSDRDEL